MPNDTSFAVMYKKLVDHNFDPDPQKLTRTRSHVMGQIFAHSPPKMANLIWTKQTNCDRIHSELETGEDTK